MIGTAIPVADLAAMARALADKAAAETGPRPFCTADVHAVDNESDRFVHVQVHVDGDPPGQLSTMPAATGPGVQIGQRVLVKYVRPCGAWVIGPIERGSPE